MGIFKWIKDYIHDIRVSSRNTFKNVVLTAHFWVILISLGIMIASGVMIFNTLNARRDQDLGKIWQNGGKTSYRQMSVFAQGNRKDTYAPLVSLGSDKSITLDSVMNAEEGIRKKLQGTVDSGKTIVTKPGQEIKPKGWEDCYSTTFMTKGYIHKEETINGEIRSADVEFESEVVAVGGNFAAFHPYEYMSGGFLPVDVKDEYQIVINDQLAWELYRSYDVIGNRLQVFGQDCTIIGVVREKKTSIDQMSGGDQKRLFCYFKTVVDLQNKGYFDGEVPEGDTKDAGYHEDIAITCYEAFLPEAVKGVAKTDILNALPSYNIQEPQYLITSNTGRYRIDKVYDYYMPIGEFQSKYANYEFPYWEKTAQLATERLFFMEVAAGAGIILFIIGIIIAILRLRKPGGRFDTLEKTTNEEEAELAIQMT